MDVRPQREKTFGYQPPPPAYDPYSVSRYDELTHDQRQALAAWIAQNLRRSTTDTDFALLYSLWLERGFYVQPGAFLAALQVAGYGLVFGGPARIKAQLI
jgi:hypothetical protein